MIFVTGCAGFIGSHLCESLLKDGNKVLGIDNFDQYYADDIKKANLFILKRFGNFTFYHADITDKNKINELFSKYHFSTVVHLAARPGVASSLADPLIYAKVNIVGTLVLLEQMKRSGKSLPFIFGSSSSVYGGLKKVPFSEGNSTKIQLSPYGMSKKTGEIYCRLYHDLYGTPVTILRFFTVYGPRVRPDMAISKFIKAIKKGDEINLYNDGEVERDYTYIDDIIEGIKKAIDKKLPFEIINLGNSHPVKMKKIVTLLEKYLGKKAKIKTKPLPSSEMSKTWADITKARRLLSWRPKIAIEEGINKLILDMEYA
jgi:UDP-glucuronate 4-epimerase